MEKEGAQWKGKWENANRALLEMAEEKTKYDKERSLLMTKINKLESLCRAMQAERQARKLLESEKLAVSSELEKLGLHPDRISVLPDNSEPACSEDRTGSSPVPDTSQQVADSTTSADEPESKDPNTGTGGEGDSGTGGEGDSDNSCASEQTGVTVIQQEPPDAEPSLDAEEADNQSESLIQEVTSSDQSGTSTLQEADQSES